MKNKNILWGCGIVTAVFFMFLILIGLVVAMGRRSASEASMQEVFSSASGKERIGLLYITGTIHSGRSGTGGFMSDVSSGSDTIVRTLRKASRRKGIKAFVIRINSPGGSAAGSQEIFNEIMRIRVEENKLVVASFGDVAASGGYYVASACDVIYSNPSTLTGSIGVIMSYLQWEDLMEKLGLDPVVMTSGKHKDMGSPYRDLSPEEREMFDDMLGNIHEQFIADVAKGRDMDIEVLREIADGRIMTGEQALGANLVDHVGGLQDAVLYASEQTGLGEHPHVEILQRENPFAMFFDSLESSIYPGGYEAALEKLSKSILLNGILQKQ